MICSILLLITLTSCVSGLLVVNVTQRSYQAEENHNVTLEWTFKTNTGRYPKSINIICDMFTDLTFFVLFHLREGVEVSESQHERFAGRVQFDKDVLREGRLRLHMSRLRTDDSGVYQCGVTTGDGWRSRKCHLNVTAPQSDKTSTTEFYTKSLPDPDQTDETDAGGRLHLNLLIPLVVFVSLVLAAGVGVCFLKRRQKLNRQNDDVASTKPLTV